VEGTPVLTAGKQGRGGSYPAQGFCAELRIHIKCRSSSFPCQGAFAPRLIPNQEQQKKKKKKARCLLVMTDVGQQNSPLCFMHIDECDKPE